MRPALFLAALALGFSMLSPPAASAQRGLDLARFSPAPDGDGFLGITGTRTPGPFRTNFGLFGSYVSQPLVLRSVVDPTDRLAVVSDRVDLDAFFQVGLLGHFALVVDAPVVAWQNGNGPDYDGGPSLAVVAVRDPRLAFRARLLGEDATVERQRHEGEGLAIQVSTTVPLGHTDSFAGEGAPVVEGALLGDFHLLDFGVGAQIGWRHHFSEPTILGVPFRNQLYAGLAIQVPAFFLDHLVAIAEVDVTTDGENPFGNAASTACEWRLGGRYTIQDTQITVAGGTGLVAGVGAPSGRLIVGVTFAPRVHDRDADGIVDDHDACETLPEDFDQHEDEDGCPEPDNDGDLVPDLDDHCPNEAADFELDVDEDGCNDPIGDTDGDGLRDDLDDCGADAEDLDGHDDADGCPDLDDDGDGVPDASDTCPGSREDVDGWQDEDGCADPDDDDDQVPDASDACPRLAEDRDGHDDADGCPDLDDDHDGVPDASDACLAEAETINGRDDTDGCPDAGRGAFRSTAEARIEGRLSFGRDGSLAATQASALDQLAQWLRAESPDAHSITVAGVPEAGLAALREALVARGIGDGTVVAAALPEPAAPRGTVVVTRAAAASPSVAP